MPTFVQKFLQNTPCVVDRIRRLYPKELEATARIIVARRCKQTGMHWSHHNAACFCVIIARLHSVA